MILLSYISKNQVLSRNFSRLNILSNGLKSTLPIRSRQKEFVDYVTHSLDSRFSQKRRDKHFQPQLSACIVIYLVLAITKYHKVLQKLSFENLHPMRTIPTIGVLIITNAQVSEFIIENIFTMPLRFHPRIVGFFGT